MSDRDLWKALVFPMDNTQQVSQNREYVCFRIHCLPKIKQWQIKKKTKLDSFVSLEHSVVLLSNQIFQFALFLKSNALTTAPFPDILWLL